MNPTPANPGRQNRNICLDDRLSLNLYNYLSHYPQIGIDSQTLYTLLIHDSLHFMVDGFTTSSFGRWQESVDFLLNSRKLIPMEQSTRTPKEIYISYLRSEAYSFKQGLHDDIMNMCYCLRNETPLSFSHERCERLLEILTVAGQLQPSDLARDDIYLVEQDLSVAKWTIGFEIPSLTERSLRRLEELVDRVPPDWKYVVYHSMKNQLWISPDELVEFLDDKASGDLKSALWAMQQEFVGVDQVIGHLRQERQKLDVRFGREGMVLGGIEILLEFAPLFPLVGMTVSKAIKRIMTHYSAKDKNWLVSLNAANNRIKQSE